jgi:Fungal specific transcription factor domain
MPTVDAITIISTRLNDFSSIEWATTYPERDTHEARHHLACTYKSSIELYANRVIAGFHEPAYLSDSSILSLVNTSMTHLLSINTQDTHFRGLIWPTFVTGAEAQTETQRIAIRSVLDSLWKVWRCQNVRSALEVLEDIWARESLENSPQSWVDHLHEKAEDWLFV